MRFSRADDGIGSDVAGIRPRPHSGSPTRADDSLGSSSPLLPPFASTHTCQINQSFAFRAGEMANDFLCTEKKSSVEDAKLGFVQTENMEFR